MTRWRSLMVAALAPLGAGAEEIAGARQALEPAEIRDAVAAAPSGRLAEIRLCNLLVYSRDKTATNLRAGPSRTDKVIATLPPQREEAGTSVGPEFQVIAGLGEWFLIRGAHWAGYDLPEGRLALGPAWMAANLAGFEIWSPDLKKEPREAAETIVTMASPADIEQPWGPDSAKVERVYGCSGSYVDVRVALPDGRRVRGWAAGLCNNQVTTCGGFSDLYEERDDGLYRSPASCRADAGSPGCQAAKP